jgi:hypothetical protein
MLPALEEKNKLTDELRKLEISIESSDFENAFI